MSSGIAGIVSVGCYFLAVLIPWPETQVGISVSLLVVSGFPLLGIVFSYGLYSFVAEESEGTAKRLAFVSAAAAFTTLLRTIIAQLAVGAGISEITKGLDDAQRPSGGGYD